MPGSRTTPGRPTLAFDTFVRVAFRLVNGIGTRNCKTIAAKWLACISLSTLRRCPHEQLRITGDDVGHYSFIIRGFYPLLLAGPGALTDFGRTNAAVCAPKDESARTSTRGGHGSIGIVTDRGG